VRIAVIAPPWLTVPPVAYGGTESVVDRECRGFQELGHEVMLFTTGDSTCPVRKEWIYDSARGFGPNGALTELRHVFRGYELARDYDIVHDHTVMGPVYAAGRFERPIVTTNHGPFNAELTDLYRATEGHVALVAISHHQASTANGVTVTRVIHHGVDPEAYPIGDGSGGYLMFLGRMTPEKGAREAAQIARRAGVRLLLGAKMQEAHEREYFEQQVRPLLDEQVRYVGELGPERKIALLRGARALLNPICWPEPFGLVMIESLACGTPVLAFPNGAAPEILEDGVTGYLCGTDDEMVDRIGEIEKLDRAACRAVVEGYFSTTRMAAEHLDLFDSILAGARVTAAA
jgi:glycosyltransferase involved in cell wall biosynthesis